MQASRGLKRFLGVIAVFGACFSLSAAPRFGAQTFILANGLQVVVIRNARAPIVHHALWFKCGGVDDPEGESGTAHFVEHMMFKRTKGRESGTYSKLLSKRGAEFNAFTSKDFTCYYVETAKEHLPLVMELEAARMRDLELDADEVSSERKVIIEERRSRVENSPDALLDEAVRKALYWHHPYGRPLIGWLHEMQALQLENVQAFYRYWYAPNNAILVLAGDVELEEAKVLAEKYYGPIERRTLPERTILQEPIHHNVTEKLVLKHERVEHPTCAFFIPLTYKDEDKDPLALDVIHYLLFNNPLGRFYQKFVEEKKIASSIHCFYERRSLGPKYIEIEAQPAPGVTLSALKKAIADEVDLLKGVQFTQEEVKTVVERILIGKEYERDNAFAGAYEIGKSLSVGATIAQVEKLYDVYASLDVTQVNQMMQNVFSVKPAVLATLMPVENKT